MRNPIPHFLLLILMIVALAGCSTSPAEPAPVPTIPLPSLATPDLTPTPAGPFPMTIKDGANYRVTLPAAPQRIVSLAPGHTEILFALGLEERLVGVSETSNYPAGAIEKPRVTVQSAPSLQRILAQQPQLVLALPSQVAELAPGLQEANVPLFASEPDTLNELLNTILTIGHMAGRDQAAMELVLALQARLDTVQTAIRDAPPPTVYWELSADLTTAGPGTLPHDLIVAAGGENVAANSPIPWLQLGADTLIERDPQVIVLASGGDPDAVRSRPGWQGISAVRSGRIISVINREIISRPGPRIVEGVEWLARLLHPDRFP